MARQKFNNTYIQSIYNKWIDTMVNQLAIEGKKVIEDAYISSNDGDRIDDPDTYNPPTWKNVTGTLKKSYGSAVYVNGKLRLDSMRFVGGFFIGENASDDYIRDYLKTYKGNVRNVIELICVNAAPYADDLENGNTIRGNEYFVISQMVDEMEDINRRIIMPNRYRQQIKKIGDF